MGPSASRTLYRAAACVQLQPPGAAARAPRLPEPFRGAAAILVVDERIAWLGPDTEADRHVDEADEVIGLEGRPATPAFVDAHAHLSHTGAALRGVDLSGLPSLRDALARIEAAARVARGRPVFAPSWDESTWPERRGPTGSELDRAAYGGVVYAPRVDGHSAVISSALAAASGAARHPGWLGDGLVTREAHHAARAAFDAAVTPAQRRADIELALRTAAAAGIGTVHENGGPVVSSAADFAAVLEVGERHDLPDVVGYWAELVASPGAAREVAARHGARGLAGDLNIDGSLGSGTAHLREPYTDQPAERGTAYLSVEQVRDHVAACTLAGLQAGFHVIGDAGVDTAIAGFEAAAQRVGLGTVRDCHHRLEHVEMIDAEGVARLARLGVVASVQPGFDALWGGRTGMYAVRLGPSRAARMNPFGTMLSAGVTLALGSDSPVTPFAPWEGIRACALHHEKAERVSQKAAFEAHTAGGWAAAAVDDGGQLAKGQPATFVVWDCAGPELPALTGGAAAPTAVRTVVRGRTVHLV